MAFLKNTRKIVLPVNKISVRVGVKGLLSEEEDMKPMPDLESCEITVEYGTEDRNTFESGIWSISDLINKNITISMAQKRIEGDEVSDYLESTIFGDIDDAYTALEIILPSGRGFAGAFLLSPGAMGGEASALAKLEFECKLSGKPEIIGNEDQD